MTRHPEISINGRAIGRNHPPYLIAEISANHGGSIAVLLDSISAASQAGADAVKIQTYTPDTMTLNLKTDEFMIKSGRWKGQSLYELYEKAHTPYEWHEALFTHARNNNITLFSTPFDDSAIRLLEKLNTPAYKIASFEIGDTDLIRAAACTKKPIIISTGMAKSSEIFEAYAQVAQYRNFAFLHCISDYPAEFSKMNLAKIQRLEHLFKCPVGLSDHSMVLDTPMMAICMGASIIEKHFILNKTIDSPDKEFSFTPAMFESLRYAINDAWNARGSDKFLPTEEEKPNLQFKRSLYVIAPIKKGDTFTAANIKAIRPGHGDNPRYMRSYLHRCAACDLQPGTPLKLDYIER